MEYELTSRRLREALNDKNLKPQELSVRSGVSKASISQYVNGSHSPSNLSSSRMASVLEVNPLWLMGFDVPKYKEEDHITPSAAASTPAPSPMESQLLDNFRQLNSEGQQKAVAYVSDLADLPKYKKVSDSKAMA